MAGTDFFQSDTGIASPPYKSATTLTMDSDRSLVKNSQVLFCGGAEVVTASGWAPAADGTTRLAQSLTAKIFYIPITGLKVGDVITAFRITGQVESGGNAATLDADLRKVTAGTADVTDASLGAITQVSVTADATVNSTKTLASSSTVASLSGYYVVVTGTTGASTDIAVIGVEVTVNRK